MRRRHLLPIALCLPLARLAWAQPTTPEPEDPPQALPHFKVSAARLQAAVAQRFPLRYPVQGLMNLDVQVPQLRLLPALNHMGAEMVVHAAGPALQRSHQGTLEVEFALRYEATDRTLLEVVLHTLRPQDLALPDTLGMQPGTITVTSQGLTIGFVPKAR